MTGMASSFVVEAAPPILRGRPISQIIMPTFPGNPQRPTPPINRRHSANPGTCRPLRSSPLAGPALFSEGPALRHEVDTLADAHSLPRRSLSSSPDLRSLSALAPPLNYTKSPDPDTRDMTSMSPHSIHVGPPGALMRRSSFLDLGRNKSKRKRKSRLYTDVPPVPTPPIPEWALRQTTPLPFQRTGSSTESQTSTPVRGKTQSSQNYVDPTSLPPQAVSRALTPKSDENWLTSNPYDITPRFSRLSLSASNVVLPVSAREHKRLSKASSRTSMLSFTSGSGSQITQGSQSYPAGAFMDMGEHSPVYGSQSVPSLSLTRTSSNSSSKSESFRNSTLHTPSSTLSLSEASWNQFGEAPEVEKRRESHAQDALRSDALPSEKLGHRRSLANLGTRIKRMSIRSSESKTDIRSYASAFSYLPFGTDSTTDLEVPTMVERTGGAPGLELADHSLVTTADREPIGDPIEYSPKPKRSGTVRRLWRTLSSVGRKGA